MIQHEKENPSFTYVMETERQALLAIKDQRGIPKKAAYQLLTAK
jgi:hypothetical protein